MTVEVEPFCAFCFRNKKDVKKIVLVAGGSEEATTFICRECIEDSHKELTKSAEKKQQATQDEIPTPKTIKAHLDKYIIGQDDAKQAVAVAVYNHYKRLSASDRVVDEEQADHVDLEKSNILLIGPTGCGKTLFARTIAKLIDVPFTIADATSLTEAGYVGEDVESIIMRLVQAANYDVKRAEKGIVYLDEIDKKARRGDASSNAKDVSGEGVQQALLKLLEGSEVYVPTGGSRRGPQSEMVKVDTSNILFICGGAFVGIEDTIKRSQKKGSSIGFAGTPTSSTKGPTSREIMEKIDGEHLSSYGIIPELVGRLPIIAVLNELDEDQLVRVLTEPRNAITKQFASLFGMDHVALEFEDAALHEMARMSISKKTGARGLRGVLEKKLMRLQFDLPDLRDSGVTRIVITKDMIAHGGTPQITYG